MQNIILNFQSDTTGVDQSIDKLDQLAQKDAEVEAQARDTMKAFEDRDKAGAAGTKKTASELDKLTSYFKNLDKAITGGAYSKTLKDLDKAVTGTTEKFKALGIAVELAKKKQAEFAPQSAEWSELGKEIEQAQTVLQAFREEEEEVEKRTQSFRSRLREMKQALLEMEEAGRDDSDAYRQMAIEAAKLEDQIGDTQSKIRTMASDTFVFDALIEGVQGLAAGFAVAQGAAALFGDENEDVQKALLKVNAAMSILQGLQQLQKLVQEQTAISLAIENTQRKVAVITTNLQAAAESRNVVVKYAAIAAQRILNVVMAASPAGILLAAVAAVAAALVYFTSNAKAAAEAQAELNTAMNSAGAGLDAELSGIDRANKKIVASLKELGASDDALAKQQIENSKLRLAARQREIDQLADVINKFRDNDDVEVEDKKKANDRLAQLQQDQLDDQADVYAQQRDLQRKEYLDGIKSAQAYAEARVLIARQGSREELRAQTEAIRVRANAEKASNPNLTAGERVKIEADALRQIAELQFNFDQNARQQAIKALNAKADLEKEDSRRRLDLELTSLDQQKGAELQTTAVVNGQVVQLKELTEKQKQEIEDRYLKLSSDKIREYARKDAEYQVQQRIAFLSGDIARLEVTADAATNETLLAQKKQLIDEQARLEIISINDTVHNEETRRAKVREVYDKALADKVQLEKAKAKAEIDFQEKLTTANYNREAELIKRNNDLTGLSFFNKTSQATKYFDAVRNGIEFELAANEDRRAKDLISEEEYLLKKQELQQQADDNEYARRLDHQRRMDAIRDLASQTAVKLLDFEFNISQKHYAAEQQRIQDLYDQKKISETEYNNQLKTLRQKQDKDAKAQALFQTLIQEGPTILKGFQQGGFAGVAAAFTLFFALLSAVQSAEVPQYAATGKILVQGKGTETSDSIPMMVSKNESVIRASQSKKHTDALRAINEDRYEQHLRTVELPRYFQTDLPALPDYVVNNSQEMQFDYDKMGEVMAQKLAENPHYSLHFDEQGFHLSVKQGSDRVDYVNKKLTT